MRHPPCNHPIRGVRQAGLTLIEFMVSIVIGMLMIAALATLIANQSATRAEIDKSGRMIENGRYAIQTMANDVQLAGYWGELSTLNALDTTLAHNPCSVAWAEIDAAMPLHVQGYDAPASLPSPALDCATNHKAGTDVLVVRRVDPDTSAMETAAGLADFTSAQAGQIYLQTGLNAPVTTVARLMRVGTSVVATDSATFTLTRRDGSASTLRKVVVNIYYVSTCSVCAGGGDGIPTLKRVELGVTAAAPAFGNPVTLAEGIEDLQVDYGLDTDADGAANGVDVNGSTLAIADWTNVVTLKIHLIARSNETTVGFQDSKTYTLGTAAPASAPVGGEGYKRHVFVQSVRLVNPSSRRAL